jgi:hypothetical protein
LVSPGETDCGVKPRRRARRQPGTATVRTRGYKSDEKQAERDHPAHGMDHSRSLTRSLATQLALYRRLVHPTQQ